MIRSYAPGFIFTTSLPPVTVAGAHASIVYQKEYNGDRTLMQWNVRSIKARLAARGIPVVPGPSHIVPVLIGDAAQAKAASDYLLAQHNVYVQAINFPTVARGEERLRFTITPGHTAEQLARVVDAVDDTFTTLSIRREQDWRAEGGRCGVGVEAPEAIEPVWTDSQLHIGTPAQPRTRRDGQPRFVEPRAVAEARGRFDHLLGKVPNADADVAEIAGLLMRAPAPAPVPAAPAGKKAFERVKVPAAVPIAAAA